MCICACCGSYYKKSSFLQGEFCSDCDGIVDNYDILDEEANLEINNLLNPSGKIRPVFYEDRKDDMEM